MDDNKETPMIPQYYAEHTYMHLSHANRRMLIALITVCVTFILTILVFVHGYTVREKNWLNTLTDLRNNTEVSDGVYKQSNAAADR